MAFCDLHTHCTYSDGTCTPGELVALAKEAKLCAVALTDHNTVAGLPAFLEAAAGSGVMPVPGVEFSTDYNGTELHILALFVEPAHYAPITELMAKTAAHKEQSNRDLVAALEKAGIFLDYDAIKASTPKGQVNRALIAAEMLQKGYVSSVQEAFSRYLSPKHGYYVPPRLPDALDIIRFIRVLGAVPVLAHPFLSLDEAGLAAFLPRAVEAGLQAMEVLYPKFTPEQTALAQQYARQFSLAPSGGSDFHGENKPDIALGTGRGSLAVPEAMVQNLQRIYEENKNKV